MAERGQPGTWMHLAQWADGAIDLDKTLSTLPCSDREASSLTASLWPEWIFHVPGDKQWYLWNTRCLALDQSREIDRWVMAFSHLLDTVFERCKQQLAVSMAQTMTGQPQAAIDAAVEVAWQAWTASGAWKYAHGLRSSTKAAHLREQLAGDRGTTPLTEHHPRLLNVGNCVVNLLPRDGEPEAYRHDASLRMTYCLEANWLGPADPAAPWKNCPQFAAMINRATGFDAEVTSYLVKVLGYSLLGYNPHRLMFFMTGDTGSGKSKLLEIVSTVLGEQLTYIAKPALVESGLRHARNEATMRGKRLISLDETNDRIKLDENQVKRLTGQAAYTVELLYAKTMITVPVSWLIIITNNQMPTIDHLDDALRSRIWVIPMGPTIPEWERDTDLAERIVAQERDGILQLLVWACREAMDNGGLTMPPQAVVEKTLAYEAEQNTIALWLAAEAAPMNGQSPALRGSELHAPYVSWCQQQDRSPLGRNLFYTELSRIPGIVRSGPDDQAWFRGFILKNPGLG